MTIKRINQSRGFADSHRLRRLSARLDEDIVLDHEEWSRTCSGDNRKGIIVMTLKKITTKKLSLIKGN